MGQSENRASRSSRVALLATDMHDRRLYSPDPEHARPARSVGGAAPEGLSPHGLWPLPMPMHTPRLPSWGHTDSEQGKHKTSQQGPMALSPPRKARASRSARWPTTSGRSLSFQARHPTVSLAHGTQLTVGRDPDRLPHPNPPPWAETPRSRLAR